MNCDEVSELVIPWLKTSFILNSFHIKACRPHKTHIVFHHLICHQWWTAVNLLHHPLILAVICPIKNRWSKPKCHRTRSLTSGCAKLALDEVQWPTYDFLLRLYFPTTDPSWHCNLLFGPAHSKNLIFLFDYFLLDFLPSFFLNVGFIKSGIQEKTA